MTLIIFITILLFLPLTGYGPLAHAAETKKQATLPNIILILADDLGYGDLGSYGNNTIKTPVLDQMATEGMKFLNFYSNGAVCTPTRAGLITGNYPQRAGLEEVIYAQMHRRYDAGLSEDQVTMARLFQDHGYTTGIYGKWHLGFKPENHPNNHGFDEFIGFLSGNVDYISHRDGISLHDWWHNTDSLHEEGYVTDLITDHALNFLSRNRNEPFFLYLSHLSPHFPFQGRNDEAERLPGGVPGQDFIAHGARPDRAVAYKEMIEVLDENVGRVFRKLNDLELNENTIVIFISDNGPLEVGSSGHLRGYKASFWEGGIRVPAFVWYPEKITPGSTSEARIITMDILPTLLSMTGIHSDLTFDGIDASNVFLNNGDVEERPLFWRRHDRRAVIKGDWKYHRADEGEYLIDLSTDDSETTNLLESHPGKAEEFMKLLKEWEKEMAQYE